ncbi:MAG TPA: class I SAM-dependent methyltransferase [Bacteroidia bacterium]|nr:class I SAM-dependent methyltransferase [Bacteroidia bacterium]HRS57668.1 class I SAM-dependent methyltransferase [Bacteroidia bacterium]HRU67966.1 class I SAM-dependent methyltransferase [Bacteroidia bacterium]
MNLKQTSAVWEQLAKEDPLWAICTDPEKRGNKWEKNEFLQAGYEEVEIIFNHLFTNHFLPFDRDKALDFGCGAGRLTRALTKYFTEVVGVDVSKSMLEKAMELNADISEKISFIHNTSSDLKVLKSNQFSFILSTIVLQHIPPQNSLLYIGEFVRLLKPGGILVFQIPVKRSRPLSLAKKIRSSLKIRKRLAKLGMGKDIHMEMFVVPEDDIKLQLSYPFIEILDIPETNHTEPDFNGKLKLNYHPELPPEYISKMYIVRKNLSASTIL